MNQSIEVVSPSTRESLREKLARINSSNEFSIKSDEYNTSFPLASLIILYNKSRMESYVEYMEGFKLLNSWLSPILSPVSYTQDLACTFPMLNSYETQRMSVILGVKQSILIETMLQTINSESNSQPIQETH